MLTASLPNARKRVAQKFLKIGSELFAVLNGLSFNFAFIEKTKN
jgi:hypothetical protein